MGMSDKIEAFILELMKQEQDDWLKIQRNELAQIFGCVPSQINYVISTRFSPERGYAVESRRGGGGCVRIRRIQAPQAIYIADNVSEGQAVEFINRLAAAGVINGDTAKIIYSAVSDKALEKSENRDELRADILKNIIENIGNVY